MPVQSSAGLLPRAVIAAVVGCVAGGTAGMWSLPRPSASLNAAAPAASTASPVATPPVATPPATTPSASLPTQVALAPPPPTRISTNAPAPSASDDADVL